MKGDEVVETGKNAADRPLLGNARVSNINFLEVVVMKMYDGLSLSTFCHLVMGACASDCKREKSLVELGVWTDDVEIPSKQNPRLKYC